MDKLVADLLNGSRRALARILSIVENEEPEMQKALSQLFPHTGKAWVVGVTGAPGTGKSSLVNALAMIFRKKEKTVGIIAVDPTSPFSGGAILGDRIRMGDLSGDKGVFIRSMATRGSLGGLSRATRDAVRVMDAAGFDIIIVETVGAGQSEVDIVRTADTTLVIEAPGLGDDVQAIKAGILEIADIIVVNKSDRVGADQAVRSLRAMLELGHPAAREQFIAHHGQMMRLEPGTATVESNNSIWIPPVMKASARKNEGIAELVEQIEAHREHLRQSGKEALLKEGYLGIELYERLQDAVMRRLIETIPAETLQAMISKIRKREIAPQMVVEELLRQYR